MQLPIRLVQNEREIALLQTENWVMKSDGSFGSRPGPCLFMCLFHFASELETVKHTNQEVNIYFQCENKEVRRQAENRKVLKCPGV